MKILQVVHGYPPAAQGGAEIYADHHARTLVRDAGDEVTVLTRDRDPARPEYDVRSEMRDGLRIVRVNNTFRETRSFEATYRNDAIGAIAERLIDEVAPDVAHLHHLTCLSTTIVDALARRGIPIIYTLHDYWLMCHRGQLLDVAYRLCGGPGTEGCDACLGVAGALPAAASPAARLARGLERRLPPASADQLRRFSRGVAGVVATTADGARQARARTEHMRAVSARITHFLAPSRHMRDRFVGFGIAPGRMTVHGYGFDAGPFRGVRRTPASRLRLGFLGSLMISKGPHVLLEAFARLPAGAATLTLFGEHVAYHGDDGYREILAPLAARAGVEVRGPVPHDRVADALASIDVLVVPSIWEENSPLVIREAYLAGAPVVASRIGGIPEIVGDGAGGLLFDAGDVEDLHRALRRLLDEPGLLPSLAATLPPVPTIEDDVRTTREVFAAHAGLRRAGASRAVPGPRRLAAVVLNYRTPADTRLAVRSLLASSRPLDEILVVDNDEGPGCDGLLDGLGGPIACLSTGRNLGFSGGMNVGIRAALARGADAVLLVNSDAIVPPDCAGRLETVAAETGAGIAGPVLRSRSMPTILGSLGMRYVPWSGRMRHLGAGERRPAVSLPESHPVDAVSGCVMLVMREVFEGIGLLDEDYFFYFEDLDFCLRARAAGFSARLAGHAVAYHEGGQSIGPDSPRRLYFAARNHLLLALRRAPRRRALARLPTLLSITALNVAHALRARGGSARARFAAVVRGVRDYAAGRLGPDAGDR